MDTAEGGCLCGRVRYTVTGPPVTVAICHCTHCQKQSGSVFSVNGVFADAAYRQTGETAVFADRGDSGQPVNRHFCAACGSPIVSIVGAMPGLTIVKAGTLDDPSRWTPTAEVYCDHAAGWLPTESGRARFAQTPA